MKNQNIRWQQRFQNFQKALKQLSSAIELSKTKKLSELERQGTIQAFEFVQELSWKVLKDFLEYEGINGIIGSRSAIRYAFQQGIIEDGEIWMDMIEKRNLSTHTYNQDLAKSITEEICHKYYCCFLKLQNTFLQKL
jgi:nucleotidyltransferase substrate binding protein (TIGR01987 family)